MGDTLGRKITLIVTLVIMGMATFLVGLLPTYHQIGIFAPILLIILRFLQGMTVAGEWSGAMILVVENAPPSYRGLLSALPQTGGFSGQLLAALSFSLVALLPKQKLMTWGWRIPFLLSALLIGIGVYIRVKLDKTAAFKAQQRLSCRVARSPVIQVLKESWRRILLIMSLRFSESVPFFITTVFTVSYATRTLKVEKQAMLSIIMITCLIALPMHGLFGLLSDKYGRRPLYLFGSLFVALFAYPFFLLLDSGSLPLIAIGYIILINVGHNSINAVQPAFFNELFDTQVRFSGASIGHQLGAVVAGGCTPFIAEMLVTLGNNHWIFVCYYVIAAALLATVAAYFSPETSRKKLW